MPNNPSIDDIEVPDHMLQAGHAVVGAHRSREESRMCIAAALLALVKETNPISKQRACETSDFWDQNQRGMHSDKEVENWWPYFVANEVLKFLFLRKSPAIPDEVKELLLTPGQCPMPDGSVEACTNVVNAHNKRVIAAYNLGLNGREK